MEVILLRRTQSNDRPILILFILFIIFVNSQLCSLILFRLNQILHWREHGEIRYTKTKELHIDKDDGPPLSFLKVIVIKGWKSSFWWAATLETKLLIIPLQEDEEEEGG